MPCNRCCPIRENVLSHDVRSNDGVIWDGWVGVLGAANHGCCSVIRGSCHDGFLVGGKSRFGVGAGRQVLGTEQNGEVLPFVVHVLP